MKDSKEGTRVLDPACVASIVPHLDDMVLTVALAKIRQLVLFDGELEKWFVADEDDPVYTNVPGLLDHIRKWVHGNNQCKTQGERWEVKRRKTERRAVEWARSYRKFRVDPTYSEKCDSDLKEWVGQRPPWDPTFERVKITDPERKRCKILARSQAIKVIDMGLQQLAKGVFTYPVK
jgi:hypothetical protein